jgi:uncharacterized membrane protein
MSMGIRQIGIVNNELRGNNCDGLDLAPTARDNTAIPNATRNLAVSNRLTGNADGRNRVSKRNAITSDMMWTHHWADQHDRCAHVGGRLVCRRCLVLYPVTIVVLLLARFGVRWPENLDTLLLFALPLPLVLDFVAEHMGFTRHSPRRQIVTTFLGAIALGHALARYLEHQNDPRFWTMVAVYGGLCGGALIVHHLRDRRAMEEHAAELEAADPLVQGFASREAMLAYFDQ